MNNIKTMLRMPVISAMLLVSSLCVGVSGMAIHSTAYAAECAGTDTTIIGCDNTVNGSGKSATRSSGIWQVLLLIINIFTAGIGIAAVGGIVYGAILYTTAEDNANQVKQAISVIRNTIIGLVLFALMFAFLQFIIPGGVFSGKQAPQVAANPDEPSASSSKSTGPVGYENGASGAPAYNPANGSSSAPLSDTSSFTANQVLIIGDSITARPASGNNRGNKGWWEYLLDGKSGRFMFSAEGGSGYVQKGGSGTNFLMRLPQITSSRPKVIIIAGGLNDRGVSNPSAGIANYYTKFASTIKAAGVSPANVYVIVPRPTGTAGSIVSIVKSNANRIGANYVEVGGYSTRYDNLHPDSAGARQFERNFESNSDFDERLK